jgi:hypothetical protein
MNNKMRILSIMAVVAILFVGASPAFAQDDTPPEDASRRPLRDYVIAAFAEALGLCVEDVEGRLDAGESLMEIAASQGIERSEFRRFMAAVIEEAKANALRDGVIDEEDVDRLRERYRKRRDERRERRRRVISDNILERLGITREELARMLDSGMTWPEILESLGIERRRPQSDNGMNGGSGFSGEEVRENYETKLE